MRRRRITRILCTAVLTAGAISAGARFTTFQKSNLQTYPELKIEYIEGLEADPPVVTYETGTLYRTHEVIINDFTFEEAQTLMRLAEAEAGNQGEDGMWLVLSTVINRRQDQEWPDSIIDVIYEKHETKDGRTIHQFESVANGSIDRVEISQNAHRALARIEMGEVAPEIIAFERKESHALDKYFMPAFEFKDHRFYTKK